MKSRTLTSFPRLTLVKLFPKVVHNFHCRTCKQFLTFLRDFLFTARNGHHHHDARYHAGKLTQQTTNKLPPIILPDRDRNQVIKVMKLITVRVRKLSGDGRTNRGPNPVAKNRGYNTYVES